MATAFENEHVQRRTIRLTDPMVVVGKGREVMLAGMTATGRRMNVSLFAARGADVAVEATALKTAAKQAGELIVTGEALHDERDLYVANGVRAGTKEMIGRRDPSPMSSIVSNVADRLTGRAAEADAQWARDTRGRLDWFEKGERERDLAVRAGTARDRWEPTPKVPLTSVAKGPVAVEVDADAVMRGRGGAGR